MTSRRWPACSPSPASCTWSGRRCSSRSCRAGCRPGASWCTSPGSPSSPVPQGCCTRARVPSPAGRAPPCWSAVYPANVQMALDAHRRAGRDGGPRPPGGGPGAAAAAGAARAHRAQGDPHGVTRVRSADAGPISSGGPRRPARTRRRSTRGRCACRPCSCAPCARTRPTPRCRATGCSCAPATSAASRPGIYTWLPLGLQGAAQRRADRPRGDGRDRRPGGALPGAAAAGAVRGDRSLDRVRRQHLPAQGPQGRRLPARADARGDVHPRWSRTCTRRTRTCRCRSTRSRPSTATRRVRARASCAAASSS